MNGYSAYTYINMSCNKIDTLGVAPITQFTHLHNKNSNTQGSSSKVVKVIFHTKRNCSYRKEYAPCGSKFFPLREVPIMKRDAVKRITACSNSLTLVCVTFSAFWLRPWIRSYHTPIHSALSTICVQHDNCRSMFINQLSFNYMSCKIITSNKSM